jgi:hypothetical protein
MTNRKGDCSLPGLINKYAADLSWFKPLNSVNAHCRQVYGKGYALSTLTGYFV